MQNRNSSLSSTSQSTPENPKHEAVASTVVGRRRRFGGRALAAGAVIIVGASVGTGFVLQSAVAAQQDRIQATAALDAATGFHAEQLSAYTDVLKVRALQKADQVVETANATLAAAQGKADAAALTAAVAPLQHRELLAPQRILDLVAQTASETGKVAAAVAEFDRIAAEQAAAEAAAQAAAEQAAREAAEAAERASSAPVAASRPAAPSNPSEAQAIARDMMAANYGWGDDQFGCLVSLWSAESGWNANSYNASTGAGGIPQALPASKMASAGADWQTNPATQIAWGLGYIAGRHGTPCGAWDHFESSGWY